MDNGQAVFLIPVADQWLVYAPLYASVALVNGAAARMLRQRGIVACADRLGGFFVDLLERPVEKPRPLQGEPVPSMLGIIPTRGCNIGCTYCAFHEVVSPSDRLPPERAVSLIDWAAERIAQHGGSQLRVHFFGGEPFTAPETVEICVHRTRYSAARYGLTPYLDVSTNGVFSEARCRFVGDYFDAVILSFDGPAEFHNQTRSTLDGRGTFEQVDSTAKRLRDMPADLCLRVCVTHRSVSRLEEITDWMCRTYRPSVINFETLIPNARTESTGLLPPDPYAFARHGLGAVETAARHGIRAVYSAAHWDGPRDSYCPVGTDALMLTPDGRINACYLLPEEWQARGLDLGLGRVDADLGVVLDSAAIDRVRNLVETPPRCRDCFCQWSCAGGCHVQQTYPGCLDAYTDFCRQTRVMSACSLLRRIGNVELARALVDDEVAMRRLAEQRRDAVDVRSNAWLSSAPPEPAPARGCSVAQ